LEIIDNEIYDNLDYGIITTTSTDFSIVNNSVHDNDFGIFIGDSKTIDFEIADNVVTAYNHLVHNLKGELNNVKQVLLKLTMSKPIKIEVK